MILKINRNVDNDGVVSYVESFSNTDTLISVLLKVLKCLDITVCDPNERFTVSVFTDTNSKYPLFEFNYD